MCNDLDFYMKPIVVVTGFGPFANVPVNASWEAVQRLDKAAIERRHNVELVQLEIPVTYENVDEFVPALWETHEPKLMMHVGVSRLAKCLTIETQAHRKGYQKMDYFEKCPADHTCPVDGPVRLHTKLDVERICEGVNNNPPADNIRAESSKDAGRYLCEYMYYRSLWLSPARALFVHVPDLAASAPDLTARGLARVLDLALEQINEADDAKKMTEKLKDVDLQEDDDD